MLLRSRAAGAAELHKPEILPHSYWIALAFADHVTSAGEGAYSGCARGLIDAFLSTDSGSKVLDDSCVAQVDAQAASSLFQVSDSTAFSILGTTNLYGD